MLLLTFKTDYDIIVTQYQRRSVMKSQLLPATLTALKILQILKESSDQDHPIPQTELAQMLDVDRKTIARCLDVMEGYMGLNTRKRVSILSRMIARLNSRKLDF